MNETPGAGPSPHAPGAPAWMSRVLAAAAVYNIAWGILVVLFPLAGFRWVGIDPPLYPSLWQCVGMIVGVYGVGYAIAARDPMRHWPIVLVGLLGKVLGPIGFLLAASRGELPWRLGWTIVTNDLVWWIPFALILVRAARQAPPRASDLPERSADLRLMLERAHTDRGPSLAALADRTPLLAVFLRHAGCTFCRETLADLAEARRSLESLGVRLALVHQGAADKLAALLDRHGLADLPRVHDPERRLYRAFGLRRGGPAQLFGPRVWVRAIAAAVEGHGVGGLDGDGLQMPGVFLIHRGEVLMAFRHRSAADRPDYVSMTVRAMAGLPVEP